MACIGLLGIVLFLMLAQNAAVYGASMEDIAENMVMKYIVVENLGGTVSINLRFGNKATDRDMVLDTSLTLSGCFIRRVKDSTTAKIDVRHIDGCLHEITFKEPVTVKPGDNFTSGIVVFRDWLTTYTDFMPNWYVSESGGSQHMLIKSTDVQDMRKMVEPLTERVQTQRTDADFITPWTQEKRYSEFTVGTGSLEPKNDSVRLVPHINPHVEVDTSNTVDITGWTAQESGCSQCIIFQVNSALIESQHKITVESDKVIIEIQALNQKRFAEVTLDQLRKRLNENLPIGTINNSPRFGFRCFMMDIARNFQERDTIIDVLRLLSDYKINKFHLHMGDDEGWRLEIDGLEELTEVGSQSCFNEAQCNTVQLGQKINQRKYLTKEDYKNILTTANDLGIEVIPEFDMPGHSNAAIIAMNARYDKDTSVTPDQDYRLAESYELDPSKYYTAQFYMKDAINPCLNSTYNFIRKIVTVVKSYHTEAKVPLTTFHIGGDEVGKGAWTNSTACLQKFPQYADAKETLVSEVLRMFMKTCGEILEQNGISNMVVWEDGLLDKARGSTPFNISETFPENLNVIAICWQNVWIWGVGNRAYDLANAGYQVVLGPATDWYMDHPYEPSPEERGFYWASRYSSLYDVFRFKPDDYYDNINHYLPFNGLPLMEEDICRQFPCPPLEESKRKNIIGVESTLFSETIRTRAHLESNMLPRLVAMADRAWYSAPWENTKDVQPLQDDFLRFKKSVAQYELQNIQQKFSGCRISPPAVKLAYVDSDQNAEIHVMSEFLTEKIFMLNENGTETEVKNSLKVPLTDMEQYLYFRTKNAAENLRSAREVMLTLKPLAEKADTSAGSIPSRSGLFITVMIMFLAGMI